MMFSHRQHVQQIDTATLTPLVQQLTGTLLIISDWSVQGLGDSSGEAALGIYRFSGTGFTPSTTMDWSLYLKILSPAPLNTALSVQDPAGWNYWRREAEVYSSPILAQLPIGLAAPRCLGVSEQHDGSVWLWMEDVAAVSRSWSVERLRLVAHQLGQFSGGYLSSQSLPVYPWIGRDWLRGFVDANASAIEQLRQTRDHRIVQLALPEDIIVGTFRTWSERSRYFNILDRLPQTLCHMDFYSRNLLSRSQPTAGADTMVLDWAFLSIGAIGEDLVPLIIGSLAFYDIDLKDAHTLESEVLTGYLEGLHETGWNGDPQLVYQGYAAAGALRYLTGCIRLALPDLLDPAIDPDAQHPLGPTNREVWACWADIHRHFTLRLADEV